MLLMLKDLADNFFLRRLHSLSGVVPIGGFLFFHLFANSSALVSAESYNTIIDFLRGLPFVEYIEWFVLFIPIGFHAIYGIIINSTAKPNQFQYSHMDNWRYFLQRATGAFAMVYILYHIIQFKTVEELDYNYIAMTLASGQVIPGMPELPFLNPFSIYWFYIISLLAINYHFSNGIWSFCITWGITVGKKSQMMVGIASVGVFFLLMAMGVLTVNHLADAGKAML